MAEEHQPLSLISNSLEKYSPNNSFYDAINKNQKTWRETKHGLLHPHEMPRVSEKIEQNMKRIFAAHLDSSYPRVLVTRTVLQDTIPFPTESPFYNYGWDYRYPETITQEDRSHYAK